MNSDPISRFNIPSSRRRFHRNRENRDPDTGKLPFYLYRFNAFTGDGNHATVNNVFLSNYPIANRAALIRSVSYQRGFIRDFHAAIQKMKHVTMEIKLFFFKMRTIVVFIMERGENNFFDSLKAVEKCALRSNRIFEFEKLSLLISRNR